MSLAIDVRDIEIDLIVPSPFNSRKTFDEVKLKELSESIRQKGVINMITVRKVGDKYEIVCGERRYRASKMCGMKSVPASVRELSDQEALEFQVIENLQRDDVHPLEEAEGYELLMKKYGYKTVDDIAVKVGKSKGYVYGRMKLCDLIPANRKLFYAGKLSPSVALVVARIPADLQKAAGDHIAKGGGCNGGQPYSYRRALEYVQEEYMLRLQDAPFDTKDDTLASSASCSICTKRTGNQKELFPDITNTDMSSDPMCFKKKTRLFGERAIAQAKAAGRTVLSVEEAKKVFPYKNSSPEGSYVGIDETCYESSKNQKYRELAKKAKDANIVYAIHPYSGAMVEMIKKDEVARILKQLGIKSGTSSGDSSRKDAESKARKDEKIRKLALAGIVKAVSEQVRRDTKLSFLRILAEAILRDSSFDGRRLFAQAQDIKIKGHEAVEKIVKEHFEAISDSELHVFCLEVLMFGSGLCTWTGQKYGKTAAAMAKHYGVDIARIEAAVRKEVDEKQKKPIGKKKG